MNSSRFDLELNLPHNAYNDGDILSMLELLENDKFFTKKKKLLEDMASHVSKQSFAKDLKSSLHLMLQRARIINLDECLGAICGAGVVKGFMVCFKQISATASKTDAMHDLPSTSHVNDANEVPSSGSSKEKAESYEQLSNSIVEVGAEVDHTRDLVVVPTWSNLVTPKAASHLAAENIMEDENLRHIGL